jgi:hypothetical protein
MLKYLTFELYFLILSSFLQNFVVLYSSSHLTFLTIASLEESLDLYQRGMKLSSACDKTLKDAENKVNQLIKEETIAYFPLV